MRFASRVDRYFHVLMGVLAVAVVTLGGRYLVLGTRQAGMVLLLVALPFLLVVLPVYCRTYYVFQKGFLSIHCGLFFHRRVPYSAIRKAVLCEGMLATAGLSGCRVDLLCQERDRRYVLQLSPQDREAFLQVLLTQNPFVDTFDTSWGWPYGEDASWEESVGL